MTFRDRVLFKLLALLLLLLFESKRSISIKFLKDDQTNLSGR